MARLPRIVGKIFGSSAGPNQIGVFGSLFAGSEATTTSAATAQSLSNWLTGWFGAAIGGNAPAIEDMNSAFFVHSHQIAYTLQQGIPEWNTDTEYFTNQFCSESGNIYISIADNNSGNLVSDTSKWKLYSFDVTGTGKDFWGTSLPAGYIWASGKTIGSAASGATERANADTLNLYTIFWNAYSNTLLPIFDSAGVATTRGANAAADFNANKRLSVIDKRGRVSAGVDNLGGTTAGRLTNTTIIPDGTTLGGSGGEQTHQLTSTEMPSHTHSQNAHSHTQQGLGRSVATPGNSNADTITSTGSTGVNTLTTTATNNNTGGDAGHNNVQPTILCNYIIKL